MLTNNRELATVVCVYKSGGTVYTREYVERLYFSVMRFGARNFICLTDDNTLDDFCQTIHLERNLPGWWSKLEMFRLTEGKYVYFDLDTIINGSIIPILSYPHKFSTLKDFNKKVDRLASGVIAWEGDYRFLYDNFEESLIERYTPSLGGKLGDQAYIEDMLQCKVDYLQDLFPNTIASYKWDSKETKERSSIICYHGKPRPHETGWAL